MAWFRLDDFTDLHEGAEAGYDKVIYEDNSMNVTLEEYVSDSIYSSQVNCQICKLNILALAYLAQILLVFALEYLSQICQWRAFGAAVLH